MFPVRSHATFLWRSSQSAGKSIYALGGQKIGAVTGYCDQNNMDISLGALSTQLRLKPSNCLPDPNFPEEPDDGSLKMLKAIGQWMRLNGEGIYGSRAWEKYGEGTQHLPGGKMGSSQAKCVFSTNDFRFMVGSNGCLYAYCMTVPAPGAPLKITSLGTDEKLLASPIKLVSLLGSDEKLDWKQEADGLVIACPKQMPFHIAVGFKIEPAQTLVAQSAKDNLAPN